MLTERASSSHSGERVTNRRTNPVTIATTDSATTGRGTGSRGGAAAPLRRLDEIGHSGDVSGRRSARRYSGIGPSCE